jgi:YesN/AraC family two-component response regulator
VTYKVLIVDDSKLARMAVVKALNALRPDWLRVEAANADEALARINEQSPDIVLLDFNMPGKDGLVFAAEWSQR